MDGERITIGAERREPEKRSACAVLEYVLAEFPVDLATGVVFLALWSDAGERPGRIIANSTSLAGRIGRTDGPVRRSLRDLKLLGLITEIDHDGRRITLDVADPEIVLKGRLVRDDADDRQHKLDLDQGEVADVVNFAAAAEARRLAAGQVCVENVRQPDKNEPELSGSHDHERINLNHDHDASEEGESLSVSSAAPEVARRPPAESERKPQPAPSPTATEPASSAESNPFAKSLALIVENARREQGIRLDESRRPDERRTDRPAATKTKRPRGVIAFSDIPPREKLSAWFGPSRPVTHAALTQELANRIRDGDTNRVIYERWAGWIIDGGVSLDRVDGLIAEMGPGVNSRGKCFGKLLKDATGRS